MGQVKAGDLKKFVDQPLQPLRFAQGDAGIFGPHGRAEVRLVPQQGQIADDTGQRRFQVVGQVDDQVIFPLLSLLCLVGSV